MVERLTKLRELSATVGAAFVLLILEAKHSIRCSAQRPRD